MVKNRLQLRIQGGQYDTGPILSFGCRQRQKAVVEKHREFNWAIEKAAVKC